MISRQKNFVFVHIPKTAGTSVEEALLPFTEGASGGKQAVLISRNWNPFKGPPWLQHLTASEYVSRGFVDSLDGFRTFSFVRNPWARLVSEYNSKGPSWRMRLLNIPWTFENFVLKCLPQWWEDNYFRGHDNFRHILPQYRFLTNDNNTVIVDHILRMENLEVGFQQVTDQLGLPGVLLPHERRSPNRSPLDGSRLLTSSCHYSEYYTPETKRFVEEFYKKDIELLGYEFENSARSPTAIPVAIAFREKQDRDDGMAAKKVTRQIIQIEGHTLYPKALSRDSIVFDLGANHGAFSHSAVEIFQCRCIAVEGNSKLAGSIASHPKIQVVHALVGNFDGFADLSITENDQCSSMLAPLTSKVTGKERVRMISLESLLDEFAPERVDLLKIDIEGAEVMVLDACPDSVLSRVAQIAVEFHDSLGMTSLEDIERIATRLRTLGFHWIRGSFRNYEDNLFINGAMCPMSAWELRLNRSCFRFVNGVKRVAARHLHSVRSQGSP